MVILTLLLLVIAVLLWLHYVLNCNEFAKELSKIPGRPIKFIFGNSLDILLPPDGLFYLARESAAKFDGIYRIYAYFFGAVDIYNPQDVETIISNMKYHEKSSTYNLLKHWLQDGLLLSHGTKWQQRRKILTSAFHFNVLKKYYSTIEDNSERLIKELENYNGEITNIVPVISDYTLKTICETAMGTQLTEDKSDSGKLYIEAIYGLGKIFISRFLNILLQSDLLFNLTSNRKEQIKYTTIARSFTKRVISERKQQFENELEFEQQSNLKLSRNIPEDNYNENKKKRNAMLDLLILAERQGLIDNDGIEEETDTFMFEGHDTTAAGLIYCLLSIANDSVVQTKIVEELNNIFGEDTRRATMGDLTNMRYLDCCIKESLRLYPPVPFIGRKIPVDTVLSGYMVPAGTVCNIHIFDLHRQECLFKDPLKFDPDRFLPENCKGRHNYAYIPFSAGPRNCIGQKFAMMEMKSALSAILRNYQLVPVTKHSDLRFVSDLVLRNSKPIYVQFIKRK